MTKSSPSAPFSLTHFDIITACAVSFEPVPAITAIPLGAFFTPALIAFKSSPAFENGIFPSYMSFNEFSSNDSDESEEERRIAYVAVTRAKNKLYLTSAKKRLLYGNVSRNKPSQFLLEYSGANKFETEKKLEHVDQESCYLCDEEKKEQSAAEGHSSKKAKCILLSLFAIFIS